MKFGKLRVDPHSVSTKTWTDLLQGVVGDFECRIHRIALDKEAIQLRLTLSESGYFKLPFLPKSSPGKNDLVLTLDEYLLFGRVLSSVFVKRVSSSQALVNPVFNFLKGECRAFCVWCLQQMPRFKIQLLDSIVLSRPPKGKTVFQIPLTNTGMLFGPEEFKGMEGIRISTKKGRPVLLVPVKSKFIWEWIFHYDYRV